MWNAEPVLQKKYIGYEVQSLQRLNAAILDIGVALLFVFILISMSIDRKRNKRVLVELENCGALKRSEHA